MKLSSALAILLLAIALPQARAQQNPDDQYVAIYGQLEQADSLLAAGTPRQALDKFIETQTQLQKFQKIYPDWNQKIVSYRLNYLAGKIATLSAMLPPPAKSTPQIQLAVVTNAPTSVADAADSQINGLRAQVQNLQSDNATLEAKLKEALAVRPAAVDSDALAGAQVKIQSLMKEIDLLKAGQTKTAASMVVTNVVETSVPNSTLTNLQAQITALQEQVEVGSLEKIAFENRIKQLQSAATNAPVASPVQPVSDTRIAELTAEVNTLRARLAADEAQAVPYTPEEQALFKLPPPVTATKSINELPAGSAELVAEAQNYFESKQFDKAAEDYKKILEHDANNSLALGNLAAIELQQEKLDSAETHIKTALAQNPDDAYNLSILGYVKFRQQKFDDAADALSRAAKLDPQNAEIQNYLGVTLSHKGLRTQAETALRKAIEIDPNYASAHHNLAAIYISGTPPSVELARLHYQKALDAGQPHDADLEKLLADRGTPVKP